MTDLVTQGDKATLSPATIARAREIGAAAQVLQERTALDRWWRDLSDNYRASVEDALDQFCDWLQMLGLHVDFMTRPEQVAVMNELGAATLLAYQTWLKEEARQANGEPYRAGTINVRITVIRKFLAVMHEAGIVQERVIADAKLLKQLRDNSRVDTYVLSNEQLATLETPDTSDPRSVMAALLASILIRHGMRASAAAKLTVSDLLIAEHGKAAGRPIIRFVEDKRNYEGKVSQHTVAGVTWRLFEVHRVNLSGSHLFVAMAKRGRPRYGDALGTRRLGANELSRLLASYVADVLGVSGFRSHAARHNSATREARLTGGDIERVRQKHNWQGYSMAARYIVADSVYETIEETPE